MERHRRLIPFIVAGPLFLQNLDTSVMATALPAMARSLGVEALHLNLAITVYLLSLAVFLPASGWLADRFGDRRIFCVAIGLFSVASALCGLATSIPQLVAFRALQGVGGAMMVPVGRLILLRSVPAHRMVAAMVWFTVPGSIGRVAGPLLGGLVVTFASWRWIFLLNVPFGVIGVLMTMRFVPAATETKSDRFDLAGFMLLATALVCFVTDLETLGRDLIPLRATIEIAAVGLVAAVGYYFYSARKPDVLIPPGLLKFRAFRTAVIGGMPLRIAIGASPFLLPLLLQLGFGLSPVQSGALTVFTGIGTLSVRAVMQHTIRRWGFRTLLIAATLMTSCTYGCYGLFGPTTPHSLICVVLLFSGLFNSLALVTVNTLGYSDLPKSAMSKATALSTMLQQTSISLGVALGASLLALTASFKGDTAAHLSSADFPPVFFAIGAITLVSLLFFFKLSEEEGAELRHG